MKRLLRSLYNYVPLPSRVRDTMSRLKRSGESMMPEAVMRNWKWDALAGILSGIYQGCIWTFALQIARGPLHANGFMMGIASAAPAIGFLFATFWARQMEGRSKLPFVTITWFISRGLFVLTPLIVSGPFRTPQFISLLCITPVLFSVSTPAYTAIMKDIYPDAQRGRLMSYVRLGMAASMILTARIMGHWQEQGGLSFQWMFAIGGVFGIGTALAFSQIKLPPVVGGVSPPPMGQFLRETFSILRYNRGYRWFTVSVFIAGFGNLLATTLYPIYQVDRFHITPGQIASMNTAINLAALASLFFWGWYLDRFGSLAAVLLAVGINCLTPIFYAYSPHIEWLYAAGAATGFAQSGIELGYLNTTLVFAEPGRAAHYQAVHSSFFGLRGTIAPLIAVHILHTLNYGFRIMFLLCLLVMLAGVGFQMLSLRTYRAMQAEEKRANPTDSL